MIFINPDCFEGYRFPSIGMLYISAVLLRDGLPVEYIDINFDPGWEKRLETAAPDHEWIGLTANVLSIGPAMKTARMIRAKFPEKKIIMGGPYPTVRYEELIPEYADACTVGEAEETCLELARGAAPETIAGLAWSDGGKVRFNGRRPLIEDLDSVPMPAWNLGHVQKYRLQHTQGNPVLPIVTSRGCPYNCIFCSSDLTFGNRIRYRSPGHVLEEMDELILRYGAREVHLWDDNFTLNRARCMEVCEGIARRRYRGVSFMIPSGIKPDIGDYEMFRTMRRAGFYAICIAVESGDQEIMSRLGKKVDVKKVKGVIAAARRAGILMNGFFMLGLPFDTRETMLRNIEHARSLPLHQAMFFITIPFPGTELYDMVGKEGRFLFHNEHNLYEQGYFLGRAAYEMPGRFDAATLEEMFRLANRRFYFRLKTLLVLFIKRMKSPGRLVYLGVKFLKVVFRGRQF